jgi:isoleucyl-tRNA synthetase
MDFVSREKATLEFWKANKIFEKSVELREGRPLFTFFDGPPTANGKPHIGHVITRVVKDIIPRYKTMKGYQVFRKAGWDTHGLPVELEVEKALGINGKPEIEEYGVEPFIEKCKESVWKYEKEWREMSERVGFWADMDHPYVTYHNEYIESVWWALKKIWDKGLIYKGHKIAPYCPRCGTTLSSHEVAQGYQDVKEQSVYVKFKMKDGEYFLAWTTTPWTLPSNVALTVNAKETYVKARLDGETYILAKDLASVVLGENFEIIEEFIGSELERTGYEPLFDYARPDKDAYYVCCDDFVTLTEGTGIVHTAPAFGEDDSRVGKKYDLPFVQLVDERGNFVKEATDFSGMFVKDADPEIIKKLKEEGKLFRTAAHEHSYPFCWRCDTPLLYYSRDAWFIEMTKVRDALVANNETVNWLPDNIKHGRFGNFLENVIDWGLSRERYWGTPLPIWECSCGCRHAVGGVAELKLMGENVPDDIELHKPYIDNIALKCPECGGVMKRTPEVIDCWFDSGSMPFAQWRYPFENADKFDKQFPADFISEAVDQTRGWFYTLMAISTLLFDRAPFKNCVALGHVLDKDGLKMSKHKGNVVNPWDVLNKQGADAVRWYFMINSAPWLPSRFYNEAVNESQRKFMGTFWNTYAFFTLYGNIDNFNPSDYGESIAWSDDLPPMDRWILSKLNSLIKTVDSNLENYRLTEPARAMNDFADDLSNWYVRRARERFWAKGMERDKINAYMTLYTALVTLAKLAAPYVPFMTEGIYLNIVKKTWPDAPESVHLTDFPVADERFIDKELENRMDVTLEIVALGRAARNNIGVKNRQPVKTLYVKSEDLPPMFAEIAADELNAKNVAFVDDIEEFTTFKFKPLLKTLGPKYGKLIGEITAALAKADGSELMGEFKKNGRVSIDIGGTEVSLTLDDVLYETVSKQGFSVEAGRKASIVIDGNLTPELIDEGFAREIISKVQTMRKEAGFDVLDRIYIMSSGNNVIKDIIERNAEIIKTETLADGIFADGGVDEDWDYTKLWNINGEKTTLSVRKR